MFSHAANRRVAVIVVDGLKNSFALPKVNCKKMAGHHIPAIHDPFPIFKAQQH
jgi:hypothetical protein